MKDGPDIALIGSLIGDPARANMLTALMSGKALTATELASEAGVTPQTASGHLSRLERGGLVRQRRQGRHRYFAIADESVGTLLETMMGVAAKKGHMRTRTGPRDPEMRRARVCYNHLAGELAVAMLDRFLALGVVVAEDDALHVTEVGQVFFAERGIAIADLSKRPRVLCRPCLDWSLRRSHLAGSIGSAILEQIYAQGWAKRVPGTRIVRFTPTGEDRFMSHFDVQGLSRSAPPDAR